MTFGAMLDVADAVPAILDGTGRTQAARQQRHIARGLRTVGDPLAQASCPPGFCWWRSLRPPVDVTTTPDGVWAPPSLSPRR